MESRERRAPEKCDAPFRADPNMAWITKSAVRSASLFLVARYPFINALSFLMLLAERAKRETYPFMEPNLIYGHVIVSILCGVCMSFNVRRKETALVTAGQLIYLAFNLYMNEKMQYRKWITIRMASRLLGTAGIIMLYAFFTMPKPRQTQLRRIGEGLLGLWLICATYSLIESREERTAFTTFLPFGDVAVYVWAIVLGTSAMCFLPGMFVYDICYVLIVFLTISTAMVDTRINYWTKRWGMDMWNQIRVLSDHITIILGLVMYLSCTKRPRAPEKQE